MATFRIEKNKNYTVMSNIHLRDRNLSLKAKGLLSMMLSLPEDWDYSIEGLVSICKENETSIKTTLKELKKYGYLEVIKLLPNQTDSGRIEYVYNIYETPKKQEGEKQEVENLPLENLPVENLGVEVQAVENQGQLNTNILNTDYLNTNNKTYSHLNHEGYREPISHNTIEPEATIDRGMYQEPEGFDVAGQKHLSNLKESEQDRQKLKKKSRAKPSEVNPDDVVYCPGDEKYEGAIHDFIDFRKSIKKPMTNRAVQLLVKKLEKLGRDNDERIAVIEQSIVNGWTGVYEVKEERSNFSRNTFHPDDFLNA